MNILKVIKRKKKRMEPTKKESVPRSLKGVRTANIKKDTITETIIPTEKISVELFAELATMNMRKKAGISNDSNSISTLVDLETEPDQQNKKEKQKGHEQSNKITGHEHGKSERKDLSLSFQSNSNYNGGSRPSVQEPSPTPFWKNPIFIGSVVSIIIILILVFIFMKRK